MIQRAEMSYHQIVLAEAAEEAPNLFMCGAKSLRRMKEKARQQADKILQELRVFYTGDITIEIAEVEWATCWSVGAILKVNGEKCREYDTADLLFLDLNELMLKRMIEARRRKDNGKE